jgi:alpha-amylase
MIKNILPTIVLLCTAQLHAATLTVSTSTSSRDYPLSTAQPLAVPLAKGSYTLQVSDLIGTCQAPSEQKIRFNQPIYLDCSSPQRIDITIRFSGDYSITFDEQSNSMSIVRQTTTPINSTFKRPLPDVSCPVYQDGPVTITLNEAFADGQPLREVMSNQIVTVTDGKVSLTPSPSSNGLLLFEKVTSAASASSTLNWRNANIYFVLVDRFSNGDKSNDHSYSRQSDGTDEVGTFHGGDLKGVIAQLDYIKSLGTDAIWLSPIVEQVHGAVGGGEKGTFPFYAYHGYWARDFTKIDANFGQEDDLKTLVNRAHQLGIKVLLDVVLNHPGYATLSDLQLDQINVVTPKSNWPASWAQWQPQAGENWHSFNTQINYQSTHWLEWWGPKWVRTGLPGYPQPGSADTTLSLAGLPDFITEGEEYVTPPPWLLNNPGTKVVAKHDYTVADYLIEWQADWVKQFGIDGYRVDTVKHVEGDVWQRLKVKASAGLKQWRQTHDKTGQPFWMMGEVWGLGAYTNPTYNDGFDALINFDMQKKIDKGAACLREMDSAYQSYADSMQQESALNPVSYISSHDTELFFSRFNSFTMQKGAASALLLSPGAIQVYYGDEVAREIGPYADDFHQGTRSDMLWSLDPERQELLNYWRTLGQFRHHHPAIGAGAHHVIEQAHPYVFSRTLDNDTVVVAFVGHPKS